MFRFGNLGPQRPDSHRQPVVIQKGIEPELQRPVAIGAVHRHITLEGFNIFRPQQRIDQLLNDFLRYNAAFEPNKIPVNPIAGRRAHFDMKVGNPHGTHFFEIGQHIVDTQKIAFACRIDLGIGRIGGFFHRHIVSTISILVLLFQFRLDYMPK